MLRTYGSCSNPEFVRPGLGMGTGWAEGIPNPGPTISVCSRRELQSKRERLWSSTSGLCIYI